MKEDFSIFTKFYISFKYFFTNESENKAWKVEEHDPCKYDFCRKTSKFVPKCDQSLVQLTIDMHNAKQAKQYELIQYIKKIQKETGKKLHHLFMKEEDSQPKTCHMCLNPISGFEDHEFQYMVMKSPSGKFVRIYDDMKSCKNE